MLAQTALLANGHEIAQPVATESYDIVAKHPKTGVWHTYQVKTCRVREDRNGAIVVEARRSGGRYTKEDADYFIGVCGEDVYLIENVGFSEYWASKTTLKKWTKLKTNMKGRVK
ncbi:hypothetical protein [Mechercharimyces sp. CAU 1602]|uniref:hypothetical protein n=1 Tax=Mechercharimyces sp. CAU 1602 TaxID=2973933 RepID=UPI0021634BDE|nr:hypothetical protein [Mechercharimyces sp. CAU 1602]